MNGKTSLSKTQLLKVIEDIERHPQDRVRILGEAGMGVLGVSLGAAAAGTAAAVAGASSIFGLTTAGSWLGVTIVAATPVGWILGCGAAGGAAAYGIARLVRNGALSEGKRANLLHFYRHELTRIQDLERSGTVTDNDRSDFVVSLRILIEKSVITPDSAFQLIQQVELGKITVSRGIELIERLLKDHEQPKLP